MSEFYLELEAVWTKIGLLREEDADGSATVNAKSSQANAPVQATQDDHQHEDPTSLKEEIEAVYDERDEAKHWLLVGLPQRYEREDENFHMAYEDDNALVPAGTDLENLSPECAVDREHFKEISAATGRVKKAEAKVLEFHNKLFDLKYDDPVRQNYFELYELEDHSRDGLTGTLGSKDETAREIRSAGVRPAIEDWVQAATGPGFRVPTEPSVIADIPTSASVRAPKSDEPLVTGTWLSFARRWDAERVATREEAEAKRLAYYQSIGQRAPRQRPG